MLRKVLFCLFLCIGVAIVHAQTISEYSFTTSTDGSLEDMSSGTTALLTPDTYHDDIASAVTPIGFTFTLGSSFYTQFSVNSNGQMQFGVTAISGSSASPRANTPRIAPISGDNSIQSIGKLHYKVTGSAPYRKLVVEWNTLRIPYNSNNSGTFCTLQVWLLESSNTVEFVYGQMYNMSTTQSRGVYISTSNVVGSVGNVTSITTAPTWNTSTASIVNTSFPASSYMNNLNSSSQGSRRVFAFSPPQVNTPPQPAILVSPLNASVNISSTTGLSWSSGGGFPTGFKIYIGSDNPPTSLLDGIDIGLTTTFYPYEPLDDNTTYYWQIVPYNSIGSSVNCPIWSFTTFDPLIGSGTQSDPWQVTTAAQLDYIRSFLGSSHSDKYFIQTSDIDLGVAPWNTGTGWVPIGSSSTSSFRGNYNGGGYPITGLTINRPSSDYQGLFGYTSGATITNLGLTNVSIIARSYTGAIVGRQSSGFINTCYSTGSVNGNSYVGGLIGQSSGTISNSYSTGNVIGNGNYIGGLVGYQDLGAITNSSSNSRINGNNYVGGLVGIQNLGTITGSHSVGSINGIGDRVGGFVGSSSGAIDNCFNSSLVTGSSNVGGLVGYLSSGSINKCYSAGIVTGNSVIGGLLGYNSGSVTNSYWDINSSGQSTSAGGE
ncbi:MAG TPA: GLUG motif-containing protein, partial [Candidatus Cloacimonadota bacterium]|nr:GLUG motif-containing protein [Candidatus Cloacimonadota bacterium]